MAGGISIRVDGIPELDALMAEISGPVVERAMIAGVTAGAKIFQQAITDAAPTRPDLPSTTALAIGELKSKIQIRLMKLRSGTIAAFIEPSPDVRHIARFVEYGHRIVKGGRLKSGKGKMRGIVSPHPFVRPAFDSSESAAVDAMRETILAEMIVEAEDLGLR